ncbi:ead/Ea22-like family protein [Raoultella planticola]|nr:ead/Ea22-like family protein [Raoultella planticola]
MTTDITDMALLVSKAKASVFTLEYISQFEPADIDSDDVDLRFEVDGRDTGTNVSIVDECGQAARVIGALVEALEKAQRYIEELRGWNVGLAQESCEYQQRIAELESQRKLAFAASNRWADKFREAERRIAEPESRTVTVSKSEIFNVPGGETYAGGKMIPVDTLCLYLAEHGIKWEAE